MKVIEIDAPTISRKVYVLAENEFEYLNFVEGIEVLPAMYYDNDNAGKFYFKKRHEVGEQFWADGGYECLEENGARRAFHLDSLIIHPRCLQRKAKAEKIRTRTGTGKRGRPKMEPGLKKTVENYVPTGGKRGRPKKDPSLTKSIVYVPTGGKRGRPKKGE